MSQWDGIERRENQRTLGFCPSHIEMVSDLAVIKNSLSNIEKIMNTGVSFKNGIITSLVGIVLIIVLQVIAFSYFYGQMSKQVEVNTARLTVIEKLIAK